MARDFPRLKVGDELRIWHLEIIYDELRRWRKLSGSGMISVDNADGIAPPILVDLRSSGIAPAKLTSSLATGTIASPATATMTLLDRTGTGGALTDTGGRAGVNVYNTWALSSSLASGTQIVVYRFASEWYLLQASC